MRLPAAVCLVLIANALAGCSGNSGVEGPATARPGLQVATDAAHGLDGDTKFAGVAGVELKDPQELLDALEKAPASDEVDMAKALVGTADPAVGDGKAPAWAYAFVGPKGTAIVVIADGEVAYQKLLPAGSLVPATATTGLVDAWRVDSDGAATAIAAANATFRDAVASGAAMVAYALASDGSTLAWTVTLSTSALTPPVGVWVVDAKSGQVLQSGDLGGLPGGTPILPALESGSQTDTIMAPTQTSGSPFLVAAAGHRALHLRLAARFTGVLDISATVTGPDGRTADLHIGTSVGNSELDDTADLANPAPGAYAVTVKLNQGASQAYTFQWCTDGPGSPDAANLACTDA